MRHITLMLSFVLITGIANSQTIDEKSSIVNFSIGNMKWKTVEGTFTGMKGEIDFDKANLSASGFNVSIDPASVNTESGKRDEHLKNEDFFHVDKFKTISFKSENIKKAGSKFVALGKMTLHGVTKDISIPFTVKENGNRMTFEGEIELNRFDYGLGAEKYDGTFMVGEMVTVKITCVVIFSF